MSPLPHKPAPGSLEALLKEELRRRGYVEVEPLTPEGGTWTHPEWETAADAATAVRDCLRRER